jgi:hypothetical protein
MAQRVAMSETITVMAGQPGLRHSASGRLWRSGAFETLAKGGRAGVADSHVADFTCRTAGEFA